MALSVTFVHGDCEVQIRGKAVTLINQMITDGSLTASDYITPDSSLIRFRRDMNTIFTQFVSDVAGFSSFTALGEGDSWEKVRDVLKANFTALDAVVNV